MAVTVMEKTSVYYLLISISRHIHRGCIHISRLPQWSLQSKIVPRFAHKKLKIAHTHVTVGLQLFFHKENTDYLYKHCFFTDIKGALHQYINRVQWFFQHNEMFNASNAIK